MYFYYAFINVPNYPAGGENRDVGVAYFKNRLFHTPLNVRNQGVAKYKSDIQIVIVIIISRSSAEAPQQNTFQAQNVHKVSEMK